MSEDATAIPEGSSAVTVWWAEIKDFQAGCDLTGYLDVLSVEERRRAARFRHLDQAWDYVISHALLRSLMSSGTDIPPSAWQMTVDARGKPSARAPGGVEVPFFSLTHARGLVACALSSSARIGIDVEAMNRAPDLIELQEQILSKDERNATTLMTDSQQFLLQLWTVKEAYSKAIGLGLALPFPSVTVELSGHQPTLIAPGSWHCMSFAATDEFVTALVFEAGKSLNSGPPNVHLQRISALPRDP